MEYDDLDIVVFEDEQGNEIEFEILFTFEHGDEEYAVLEELDGIEGEEDVADVYILKIVGEGDEEELVAVEEDKMDELIAVVESILQAELEEAGEHGEGCDCDNCPANQPQ
ncbi:DUF1292 domain-containing protein [Eubacteriales bacterium OttesenSCG-928-N14]|nr:DUF1292 domain-containing protein [Eubacteriales bacterium OttesenSCG-928-N14]